MITERLRGTGVATITPFKAGAIDEDALRRIIKFQIEAGVDYLVCLGTTGESSTLSKIEKDHVLQITKAVNNGRLPLMLGTFGGNDTEAIIRSFTDYDLEGVDVLLSASPAYNKPNQAGLLAHYQALSAATPLPMVIYNVPGRTSSNIAAETTLKIAETCQHIIGIKEASGDLVQGAKILKHKPADFLVISGDDPTAYPLMALGAVGVISVIANAYPAEYAQMSKAALRGDFQAAIKIHLDLIDMHQWLYLEGNPAGIKGAMEVLGYGDRSVRLPLVPLSEPTMAHLRKEMSIVAKEQ